MKQTVLFMCPHNAAKSVLAVAYCERLAAGRGLDLRLTSAGTVPDSATAVAVAEYLRGEGIDVSAHMPHRVTPQELGEADWIISMGCDLTELAPPGARVQNWHDVPAVSQDLLAAKEIIVQRLEQFLSEVPA
jgi:protein-tyrosine-phosphatase